MTADAARARWIAWLESLTPAEIAELARDVSARALRHGLAVEQPDGTRVPIPVTLSPSVPDPEELARAADGARLLASAVAKVAGDLVHARDPLGLRMLAELTPLERDCIRNLPQPALLPAIRVDYFPGAQSPRALEVNATIPAMQAYSDAAVRALAEGAAALMYRRKGDGTAADAMGAPERASKALGRLGSNRDQLWDALLACWDEEGGTGTPWVVIVHRPHDAQLPELESLCERGRERGITVELATPDRVSSGARGALVDGRPVDLVYRHIFGRRVDPASPFAQVLRAPEHHRVFNPIDARLEAKAVIARVSELSIDPERAHAAGLNDAEIDAVRRLVPWTRIAGAGPTTSPDGERVDDAAAWAAREPMRAVLKRSWDYGGKSVLLADRLEEPATRARAAALAPEGASWSELCAAAARAKELWVVQDRVPAKNEPHLTSKGVWTVLTVDLCTFTGVGLQRPPTGAVVRAAQDPVVNIVGGGGLAPLFSPAAIDALLA